MSADVDDVLEMIEELIEVLDDIADIPAAAEFEASVREKAESIKTWIEDHDYVTGPQATAIENMLAAAQNWQR